MYSYDAKSEFSAAIAPIFSVTWLEIIVIFLNRAVADVTFRDQCLFIGSIWLQSIKIGSILFVSGLFHHKYLQIFFSSNCLLSNYVSCKEVFTLFVYYTFAKMSLKSEARDVGTYFIWGGLDVAGRGLFRGF